MQTIPLPSSITEERHGANRSVFTVEPLYPGYGTTIGNAMRRILLSSLEGAAITAVKLEGVTHEFSTLPYVKEDIVDLLLNLKLVRFKVHGEGPWTATLNVTGETVAKAGDFTCPSDVEVLNAKQVIASLTDKAAKLELEVMIGLGRGYVPTENREKEKLPIGTIAVDSIYTPVKNVNFTTEHVRVEQITNFDKLMLDVTTDGTMPPAEAIRLAGQVLVEHFQFMIQVPSEAVVAEVAAEEPATESVPAETEDEGDESDDDKPKKKARKKKSDE